MRKRGDRDLLDMYGEMMENSESPPIYHTWGALSLGAMALARRVFIRVSPRLTLYPHLYTVLVGPSGKARKGEPLQAVRYLAGKLQIPTLGGSSTKESLVEDLSAAQMQYSDKSEGKDMWREQSALNIVTEEFYNVVGNMDSPKQAWFTEWHDARDRWSYRTKNQGVVDIIAPMVNMLSATDPIWLKGIITPESMRGGFASRISWIWAEKATKIIPNPFAFPIDPKLEEAILDTFEGMMNLTGEMKFDEAGRAEYDTWYRDDTYLIRNDKHPLQDPIIEGYLARRAAHLLKVSMILSAMKDNTRLITGEIFRKALSTLEEMEPNISKVFTWLGTIKNVDQHAMVWGFIKQQKTTRRSTILQKFDKHVDLETITAIINTLSAARRIQLVNGLGNGDLKIELMETASD